MAEFSKVSRGYIRMCESFGETCEGCPISARSGNDVYVCKNRLLKNPEKYEDTIMKWAEENPEPVYPTWGEWFVQTGDLPQNYRTTEFGLRMAQLLKVMATPIPADTAQKLGIEPKEGT